WFMTPCPNIAPVEPHGDGPSIVPQFDFIGSLHLKKYSPVFGFAGFVICLHQEVHAVVVRRSLNGPTAAKYETLDVVDAQVGNYVFASTTLARPMRIPLYQFFSLSPAFLVAGQLRAARIAPFTSQADVTQTCAQITQILQTEEGSFRWKGTHHG